MFFGGGGRKLEEAATMAHKSPEKGKKAIDTPKTLPQKICGTFHLMSGRRYNTTKTESRLTVKTRTDMFNELRHDSVYYKTFESNPLD